MAKTPQPRRAKTISIRPSLAPAETAHRPTRAEIDLDAIASNLAVARKAASHGRVLAVIKADGYGHGMIPVARRLVREGVYGFGVALAEEGLELRSAGIAGTILVLNGVYGNAHEDVIAQGLTPVVYDTAQLDAFHRAAIKRRDRRTKVRVHLKVDTGMRRLGVVERDLRAFLERVKSRSGILIEGVMTHLAAADSDPDFTRQQLARFEKALTLIRAEGHCPTVVHAANTAGLFTHPNSHYDFVRCGAAIFGVSPNHGPTLTPTMRLRSEIIALRSLPRGETVGYGGTFRTARRSNIATIPLGYGDGLFRSASSRGEVLVRGRRCPIVGTVSMDLTTIDVTDVPDATVGDESVLLGRQKHGRDVGVLTVDDLARSAQTIPWEVLTNVSRRVPRIYTNDEPKRSKARPA